MYNEQCGSDMESVVKSSLFRTMCPLIKDNRKKITLSSFQPGEDWRSWKLRIKIQSSLEITSPFQGPIN